MLDISAFAKDHSRNVYQFFSSLKPLNKEHTSRPINFRTGDVSVNKDACNSIDSKDLRQALLDNSSYFLTQDSLNQTKKQIANFHSKDGLEFDAKDVFLYKGGDQAIFNAIKSVCKPGDSILIPKPTYWYFD